LTVAVGGMGIDIALLVRLREFMKEECMVGLCFVERGGASVDTNNFKWLSRGILVVCQCWSKKIKDCLGWNESPPTSTSC
jgi:hypothetical protein